MTSVSGIAGSPGPLSWNHQQHLQAGIQWLFEVEQPEDALVTQFGAASPSVGNRRYGFMPTGWHRKPAAPVVSVTVAQPQYAGDPPERHLVNPLEPDELELLSAQLEAFGLEVDSTWNGHEDTGSVGLVAPAHPSLLAAFDRYTNGCPEHRTTMCGWQKCPWLTDGIARLRHPQWPTEMTDG